jgi:hypothetical protein
MFSSSRDDPITMVLCDYHGDPVMDASMLVSKCMRLVAEAEINVRVVECTQVDLHKLNKLPGYILVCKCTLDDVLESLDRGKVDDDKVCVVCTFSMQYVHERVCSYNNDYKYIGCAYVYDGIESDGPGVMYKDVHTTVVQGRPQRM